MTKFSKLIIFFIIFIGFFPIHSEDEPKFLYFEANPESILDRPIVLVNKDFNCEDEKDVRKISILFGFYNFFDSPLRPFFQDESYFYRVSEKLNFSDLIISLIGWPVTLTSKTLLLEKCSPEDSNYKLLTDENWEKLIEESKREVEEQIWKEIEDEEKEIQEPGS